MDERLVASVNDAEKILIGIGEAFDNKGEEALAAYDKLKGLIDGKDYYIVSICEDGVINDAGFDESKVVTPLDGNEEKWDEYNKWLSRTLNRKLVVLELGVGLKMPGVIRWPFEKVAFINAKAEMFRVHKSLYQTTEELGDKCTGIKADPLEFMA